MVSLTLKVVKDLFNTKQTGSSAKAQQGTISFDNPRENIDPRIITKSIITKEISGQTLNVGNVTAAEIIATDISGANLDLSGRATASVLSVRNKISGADLSISNEIVALGNISGATFEVGFASGSVLFVNSEGKLAASNSNLRYDAANPGNTILNSLSLNTSVQYFSPGGITATGTLYTSGDVRADSTFRGAGGVAIMSADVDSVKVGTTNNTNLNLYAGGGGARLSIDALSGNIGVANSSASEKFDITGGIRVSSGMFLLNTTLEKTATGGGILFVSGGALWYRGSSGTATLLGNA